MAQGGAEMSTREIAESIVAANHRGDARSQTDLEDAIKQALRERDERAAKIAESHSKHGAWCSGESGDCVQLTASAIAAAIRRDSNGEEGRTTPMPLKERDEITRYRKRNPWRAEWYVRNGTIRQRWFRTLREAREEADKHKDGEVYKEIW